MTTARNAGKGEKVNIPVEYLAVVLALASHTVAVVWWGAKLDARVRHLEDELRELKSWRHEQGQRLAERMAVVESKLTALLERLSPPVTGAGR